MEQSFKQRMRPFRFLFFIVVAPLAIFLFGTLVMYLWNALLPALFHFPLISFWQAIGLFALSRILFGGFGSGGGGRNKHRGFSKEWKEKCMNMTEEEKLEMKEKWRSRFSMGK